MTVFEDGELCILPLYYNMISSAEEMTFGLHAIGKTHIARIIEILKNCTVRKQFLAIDMQFISVFGTKTNGDTGTFEPLRHLMSEYNFIIYNIQKSPNVLDIILSDLQLNEDVVVYYDITTLEKLKTKNDEINWGAYIASNSISTMLLESEELLKKLWLIYVKKISKQISEKCIDHQIQYLPSSDIYSDTYIRIKDLFLYPDILSLSIFLLCKLIRDNFAHEKIDGIISMSNTGAILANLVGKMLDKDVVFCTNVGPKFALDIGDIIKTISKNNNYLFIFDFICLGTEIKNLKSILICLGASTIGGVGIASLPCFEYLRKQPKTSQESKSILSKAFSLITLLDHGIKYNISTTKSELEGKLNAAN